MKKSLIVFAIILSLLICINLISAEVTGDVITGKLSSESLALNITVSLPVPVLTILSPENDTYLFNTSLLLNYSQINADMVWYNLDLGDNTTITGAIYFDALEGGHTLYLYANNSYGLTTKNITFTANSTFLIILFSEYNGTTKGSSTNFISYNYGDLQNLSSIVLENTDYGKIVFNEYINITNDSLPNDRIIDLDTNTNISLNRIELNSTALPNFNKPATLQLYNLTFTTPRILKDGAVCSSSICTQNNYSGGILNFNVTEFSVYSAEETPVVVTPPSGGGGGVTKPPKVKNFSTDKDEIKVSLKQGESYYEEITIRNRENSILPFTISASGIESFLEISEETFSLNAGEEKTIGLNFTAGENTVPDLYIGKLIIKTGTTQKNISIAIEVESLESLFDIKVRIPSQFKQILPGNEVKAEIQLSNLGALGELNVSMDYVIKKEDTGQIIVSEQENLVVDKQINFIKSLKLPEDSERGNYIFYAKVNYDNKVASATDGFKIGGTFSVFFNRAKFILLTLILLVLLVLLRLILRKRQEKLRTKNKIRIINIKLKARGGSRTHENSLSALP